MTIDVSHAYSAWAHGDRAAAFSPDSPFGGDHEAVRSGRIDRGRWELHAAIERELAARGGSYDDAMTRTLAQARSGALCLSQVALEGTGVEPATRRGRDGLVHDAATGEVIALAGAPTREPLRTPGAMDDPRDAARFADTMASCQARRPGATDDDRHAMHSALIGRCNLTTAGRQIDAWIGAGGAAAAGVRAL